MSDSVHADIIKRLGGLSSDDATALLVAMLRARPSEAVRAVDACKVARPWDDGIRDELRGPAYASSARPAGEVAYNGCSRGWYVDRPAPVVHEEYCDPGDAEAAADAALVADGWVLAGGGR